MRARTERTAGAGRARLRLLIGPALFAGVLFAAELFARRGWPRLGEGETRFARFREYVRTGRHDWFDPAAFVGYRLIPSNEDINSWGFRGDEWRLERAPGVLRVACLGASTTEGGNAEGVRGSFPWHLERILEERAGGDVEVMNFGVSGWTTAESMTNWFLLVQDFAPDVVVLHHNANDILLRLYPTYRPDYTHYRHGWRGPEPGPVGRWLVVNSDLACALALKRYEDFALNALVSEPWDRDAWGAPSPDMLRPATAAAFRRNLRSICEGARLRGALPLLTTMPWDRTPDGVPPDIVAIYDKGLAEHDALLRELAAELAVPLVDLSRDWAERGDEVDAFWLDMVHVTGEGNRRKAEAIAEAILASGREAPR